MSFGWSPSDICTLAKLCHEIYSFCRTAPAELQGLFEKVDKIGRKLERLSIVLEKSGLGTWKEADNLKQHLLEVKRCLEPLRSITNKAASTPVKAKRLVRLALNQDKLKLIEKRLDTNEQELNEMKMDLILACSLRNHQFGNALQPSDSRPLKAANETFHLFDEILPAPIMAPTIPLVDQSNITSMAVSHADEVLAMALGLQSQPRGETEAAAVRNITPQSSLRNAQIANDFITDVVSLAEEKELYSQNPDPAQNLEQFTEITERAKSFRLSLRSSNSDSRSAMAQYQLPAVDKPVLNSFKQDVLGHLSSVSDNASMRTWAFDHSQRTSGSSHTSIEVHSTPSVHCSDHTQSSQLPSRSHSGDEDQVSQTDISSTIDITRQLSNETLNEDIINLSGRSKVSLNMNPQVSMSCSFNMEVSEGSVSLKVTSTRNPHASSDAIAVSGATSSPSSSKSQSGSHDMHAILPQTFKHCFQSQARPIPHFLHPNVEGPTEEPEAPYTITFTEQQYIFAEGPFEPRWTNSLMYIFHEKRDRIVLCEKIFGKTLVMNAGSNKIIYGGQEISHMSAIVMWFHGASETQSITFFPNFTSKKMAPRDIELRLVGLWSTKQARNSNSLAVVAESMARVDEGSDMLRRPSTLSGSTFFSKSATAASQKPETSRKLKCTIEFTEVSDRALFLSHLKLK